MGIKRETIVVNVNKIVSMNYEERGATKKTQFSIATEQGLVFTPFHGETNADTEKMFNLIMNGLRKNKRARFLVLNIVHNIMDDICEIEAFLYI